MKLIMLCYDGEVSSAVKLGFPVYKELPGPIEEHADEVIVRWGNSNPSYNNIGIRRDYRQVMNPRMSIRRNCSKHEALLSLSEVVKTPTLYSSHIPAGKVAVVRPWEHTGGKDFNVVTGPYNLEYGYYGVEFIRTNMEVRVWFCGDQTMIAKRARMRDHSEYPNRAEWGYEFDHQFDRQLRPDTLKAAAKIGLDCGAADVLCSGGERYFLELNSAPSVDHWRVEDFFRYAIPEFAMQKFNIKKG